MRVRKEKILYSAISLLALVIFFGGWWLYSKQETSIISSPVEVIRRIVELIRFPIAKTTLFGHIWASLRRVLLAFLAASVIGVGLGIGFGWFPKFRRFIWPVFSIVRPIPPIAWIPLVILWAGIGENSKIIIVFIAAVMPVVLNTFAGIQAADPLLLKAGKVLGAKHKQMLLNVALPDAIPTILAGMKTALSSGWLAVVAAEMVAARQGVGFLIITGMEKLDITLVLASIVVIAVISALLTSLLNKLERILCPWLNINAK